MIRSLRTHLRPVVACCLAASLAGACASQSASTPSPTPVPTPEATATPVAASPAPPVVAPTPSETPTPSATPAAPSAAPTPALTRAPTAAPSGTPTAAASISAFATERPGPTPIVGEVRPAPELTDLVTGDGQPFHLADLAGQWTIMFFGYTHCPDVCPATLGELIQVLRADPDVRVVFVTVDPERDTPEFLADWTKYYEGLIGVTGSPVAIKRAADLYGAKYARVDTGSASGYSMNHTAFQYLIDPEGQMVLTYPFGTKWQAIVGDLAELKSSG